MVLQFCHPPARMAAHTDGGEQTVELHQQIKATLLSHGVKPTSQRLEIGRLLFAQPRHMSADQILSDLRDAGSRVSKATVYNR